MDQVHICSACYNYHDGELEADMICPPCKKEGFVAFSECGFCSKTKKVMFGPYDNYICEACAIIFDKEGK